MAKMGQKIRLWNYGLLSLWKDPITPRLARVFPPKLQPPPPKTNVVVQVSSFFLAVPRVFQGFRVFQSRYICGQFGDSLATSQAVRVFMGRSTDCETGRSCSFEVVRNILDFFSFSRYLKESWFFFASTF